MIRIDRCAAPTGLAPGAGSHAYRAVAVVRALHAMQHGKCCYCEMRIPDRGLGKHVEHYRPRAAFANLATSWTNLLLACPQCNGNKSDQFPTVLDHRQQRGADPLVIDPSDPADDPETHLRFTVDDASDGLGLVAARRGSARGIATLRVTRIYESSYVRARRDHLRWLKRRWDDYLEEHFEAKDRGELGDLPDRYRALARFRDASQPFAAVTREFLRLKRLDERYEQLVAEFGNLAEDPPT